MMKKLFLCLSVLLTTALTARAEGETACAVWCAGNTTLYFTNRADLPAAGDSFSPESGGEQQTVTNLWTGTAVTASANTPAWVNTVRNTVTTVVIEPSFADVAPTTLRAWFYNMPKLTAVNGLSNINTSEVTNMAYMFSQCSLLETLTLPAWENPNVTDMSYMFYNTPKLATLNLNGFAAPAVTTLRSMFDGCKALTAVDLSGFNTSAVTSMRGMFYDCQKLTSLNLNHFDTGMVTDMYRMFYGCTALENLSLTGWTNTKTTSMEQMFYGCTKLNSLNLNGFGTPAITNMSAMFYNCSSLASIDVSGFNTASVTNMSAMFYNCSSLASIDVSGFNTASVTNMSSMFQGCSALESLNLSGWTNTKVTNMGNMFYGCTSLATLNLTGFSTAAVTSMQNMFYNCSSLSSIDVSGFNTALVTNMSGMFYNCSALTTLDLSAFNTAKVTNMGSMFYGCPLLASVYVSDAWTTAAVSGSSNMFRGCDALTGEDGTTLATYSPQSLDRTHATDEAGGYLRTGTSTELDEPLAYAVWCADNTTLYFLQTKRQLVAGRSFTPEDSPVPVKMTTVWSGTQVTASGGGNPQWYNTVKATLTNVKFESSFADVTPNSTRCWFRDCVALSQVSGIENLNTSAVTNMGYMFSGCTALQTLNLEGMNTAAVTNMEYMFSGCVALQDLDISGVNSAAVTTMQYMFNGCASLATLDLSGFNTQKVTNMAYMFQNCSSLSTVDISAFNTEKVQNMGYMFSGCSSLTELQMSNFNTSAVSYTAYMFNGCTRLNAVYVSTTWTLSKVTSANNHKEMFTGCEAIVGQDGTTYDSATVDKTKANYAVGGYLRHGTDTEGELTTYALWCENNATLYFLQSTKKLLAGSTFFPEGSDGGQVITNYWTGNSVTGYSWNNTVKTKMTQAVFESSFEAVPVTSTRYWFNNCMLLTTITGMENLNTSELTNMEYMFQNCSALQSIDLTSFNTEKVTSMQYLFYGCTALQTVNMAGLNTSAVTNMGYMFSGCAALQTLNLGGMNTAAVTNMQYMFNGCTSLTALDLSSFNTAKVSNMTSMFNGCTNLVEAYISSAWTTANVSNSTNMFTDCTSIVGQHGATYDSSYTDKTLADDGDDGYMRTGTDTDIDPTPYVIYSETNNTLYFLVDNKTRNKGRSFTPPGADNTVRITEVYTGNQITNYKTNYYSTPGWYRTYQNNITHVVIDESFSDVKPLMLRYYLSLKNMESITGLQYLNTSEATTMEYMFENCEKLTGTLDLSSFDTGKVENMNYIFSGCSMLQTINVTGLVTSKATVISGMFSGCSALENIIGANSFDLTNVTSLYGFFSGCSSLITLDLSGLDVSHITDISYMLSGCTALRTFSMKNWNIANLTSLSGLYRDLTALQNIDMSGVDLSGVKNFSYMFMGCTSLTALDISDWNTSSITSTYSMFSGCTALEHITGLNTISGTKVASMGYMFSNCSSLKEIDLSGFGQAPQLDSSTEFKSMFQGCTALENLNLANFGVAKLTDMASLFVGLTNLKTLNVTGWNTNKVTTMAAMFKGCEALESIIGIDSFSFIRVTNLTEMFYGCKSLESIDFGPDNLYVRSDLSYMFYGCESLRSFDMSTISSGSSSYRLSMESMFEGCTSLESVTGISFYCITNARNLFKGCSSLNSLILKESPRTEYLTDMTSMFEGCSSLTSLDLTNCDARDLQQSDNLFKGCSALERVYIGPDWMKYIDNTTGDETTFTGTDVFLGCTSIIGSDGTTYDETAVDWHKLHADTGGYLTATTQPVAIFSENARTLYFLQTASWASGNYYLTGSSEPIDATTVTYGENVLRWFGSYSPGEDINTVVFDSSFADVRPTSCGSWFEGCTNLTNITGLEYLNTSEVLYMDYMFQDCTALQSLDLSSFNTQYVTSMMGMFEGCTELSSLDISSFQTDSVTVMEAMFKDCSALQTIDVSRFNTAKVAVFNEMFSGCSSLQSLDLTGFDTAAADDMMGMFNGCTSLASLDLSSFNTSLVYNMASMFQNCDNLTELDLTSFDTSTVSSFSAMFAGMDNLTTLDISSFDIRADEMRYMFYQCPQLEAIYIGQGWSCSAWDYTTNMFTGCSSIEGQDGTTLGEYTDYHCAHADAGGYMRKKFFAVTIPESGYATFSCGQNVIVYDDAQLTADPLSVYVCNNYSGDRGTVRMQDITEHWEPIRITTGSGNVTEIPVTTKIVPANTGVVLKGTPGETYYFFAYRPWTHTLLVENDLVAVTKATHVKPTEGDYTNFMLKGGTFIRIAEAAETSKMPANKAYLHVLTDEIIEGGEAGIRLEGVNDDTPTEITDIPHTPTSLPEGVFDLNGRKVGNVADDIKALPQGIYIINGQKVNWKP